MFEVNPQLKGNNQFFIDFHNKLYENSIQFFLYLKNLYETQDKDKMYAYLNDGIMTKYKQEVIELSLSSSESFFIDLFDDDDLWEKVLTKSKQDKNDRIFIQNSDLFNIYKEYCKENNRRDEGNKRFNKHFKDEYIQRYYIDEADEYKISECIYDRRYIDGFSVRGFDLTLILDEKSNNESDVNKDESEINEDMYIYSKKQKCILNIKKGKLITAESLYNYIVRYYEKINTKKAFDKCYSFQKHYQNALENYNKLSIKEIGR